MNNLYEVLEICLQDIEQGMDIDTILFRYPDLADELRPILEASRNASSMAVPAPSVEVVQRNRLKVLQRAAQIRESKRSSRRIWFASLRRVAVTLVVVAALFASGTGLVRAASNTLPGDQLYPVKRTWEDVIVLFAFNSQQRNALEVEHENERITELKDLFAERRSVEVGFSGQVTSQNGASWVVAGIPVIVSAQTQIQNPGIVVGSAVQVKGQTQSNGAVAAEQIGLLPPGANLPNIDAEQEFEEKNSVGPTPQIEENSGEGEGPTIGATATPGSGSEQQNESSNRKSNKSGDSGSGGYKDGGGDSGGGDSGGGDD